MSSIRKLPGGRILVLAASLALLFSQGWFIANANAEGNQSVSSLLGNDQGNKDFEVSLKALHGDDAYEKQRAAIALGKSGNPAAVDALIAALNDNDTFVRSFAAIGLGNLKDPRALDPLIKALGDDNERVQRSAAEALGDLGNQAAVGPLIKILNDKNVFVRRSVAQALGVLGNPEAVDALIKILGDADSYVSDGAFVALTDIGNAAIPKLVSALPDWALGPKIAEVLKNLGWHPASEEETVRFDVATRNKQALLQNWQTVKKVLMSDAKNGNSRQVENAIYALIGLGREEILGDMATLLHSKGNLDMAGAFLQSGNARLSELAHNWAAEHGSEIRARDNTGSVKWGRLPPE
jgi:HEAT repeat protein